jgi:anthranilate synthase component 1
MRRRVIATLPGGWVDPADAFRALAGGDGEAFWLDSGIDASTGMSYLGTATRFATASVGENAVVEQPSGRRHAGTILDFLRERTAEPVEADGVAGPFRLGWVGWFGYELHAQTLGTPAARISRYPDAAVLYADRAIAFDHAARTVTLLALGEGWSGGLAAWRDATEELLARIRRSSSPRSGRIDSSRWLSSPRSGRIETTGSPRVSWAYTDPEYLAMVASCQRAIAAGDAYQLCLTTEARVDIRPDPVETWLALRELSPSHHGGFLRIAGISLLSSSPEQFLTVTPEGTIESKPIKGTRRRGSTPEEDAALRAELLASDKERAENLMIVDLVRNDLARVSEVGSVSVPSLLEVESYAQVHQLVSTVRGRLRAGLDALDAVASCFPAGSMTGAPKHSAVLLLDALEQRPRGVYSGAFGYVGLDGRVELAMVIRSIVLDSAGATIGTGGGITALSNPREELEETRIKAAALLRVLGAHRR